MPTQWSRSRSSSAYSATASGPPSVLRPSKKVNKRIPETRLLRRLSRLRPRPPCTFFCGSVKWMLAASEATTLPWNLPKIIPGTKAPFCSAPKRHEAYLLIIPSELKPWRDRARTIRRVGTIEIVAITAPTTPSLKAPPRPLRSTRPRLRLEIIVAATSQCVGKLEIWAGPPVTIITRKTILLTNAISLTSQKTSISLGNLLVGDWC